MKQEPATALLYSHLQHCGKVVSEDELQDPKGMESEMEINNLLVSYRPVKQDHLINDDQRVVLLAALSDSMDYVSESIKKLGQKSSEKKKESKQHQQPSNAVCPGLGTLMGKYQSQSVECLRTLRIEMQLTTLYYVQCMKQRSYMTNDGAEDAKDFVTSLTMPLLP